MRRSGRRAFGSFPAQVSLLLVVLCAGLAGCRRSSSTGTAPSASAQRAVLPLAASSWLATLEAEAVTPARVALPLGAKSPRPLLVALHGDDDRPEWTCGSYHHVTAARAFVLCPSGVPRGERFTLGTTPATRSELRALLPALKTRYAPYLAKGSVILAALGPSVAQAVDIALEEPSFFSRLLLVDGAVDRFTTGVVQRFATAGGKSVWLVCSTGSACEADAADRLQALERAGVETRLLKPDRGHGLDGEITALLHKEWGSLVREDPRWQ
jgi:hypothetical protein